MSITAALHNGPCVVCMTPTDTALAFVGVAEWCIAGLTTLGVPTDEAFDTFYFEPHEPDEDGDYTLKVRVCGQCVRNCPAAFPDPGLTLRGAGVPAVLQPRESRP
jgi:hypothetical protein